MSAYNIDCDTWLGGLSKMNTARWLASACLNGGIVYVFCGKTEFIGSEINTIEAISETSLLQ